MHAKTSTDAPSSTLTAEFRGRGEAALLQLAQCDQDMKPFPSRATSAAQIRSQSSQEPREAPSPRPGVEQGAVISAATASAASTAFPSPTSPRKAAAGLSLPQANRTGKQSPQIECAPSRLTIRGRSSNSCHQDYKPDVFLCTCTWLGAVVRVQTQPPADRLVDLPGRAHHAADEYIDSHVSRMASPDCRGVI